MRRGHTGPAPLNIVGARFIVEARFGFECLKIGSGATRDDLLPRSKQVRLAASVSGRAFRGEIGNTVCEGFVAVRRSDGDGLFRVTWIVDGQFKAATCVP